VVFGRIDLVILQCVKAIKNRRAAFMCYGVSFDGEYFSAFLHAPFFNRGLTHFLDVVAWHE